MTPKPSVSDLESHGLRLSQSCGDLEPLLREAGALSALSGHDPGLLGERLRTFEATCLSLTGQDPGGESLFLLGLLSDRAVTFDTMNIPQCAQAWAGPDNRHCTLLSGGAQTY